MRTTREVLNIDFWIGWAVGGGIEIAIWSAINMGWFTPAWQPSDMTHFVIGCVMFVVGAFMLVTKRWWGE